MYLLDFDYNIRTVPERRDKGKVDELKTAYYAVEEKNQFNRTN
jgi:hypothetical protein